MRFIVCLLFDDFKHSHVEIRLLIISQEIKKFLNVRVAIQRLNSVEINTLKLAFLPLHKNCLEFKLPLRFL